MATFNARSDRVETAPMFRDAFKTRRCLIPASGYYEWLTTPDGKQPFYFTRRDGQVMTIAGVWDEWTNSAHGKTIKSCAMVIGEPNSFVRKIHNRMPIVLEAESFKAWERGEPQEAAELMKPAGDDVLQGPTCVQARQQFENERRGCDANRASVNRRPGCRLTFPLE